MNEKLNSRMEQVSGSVYQYSEQKDNKTQVTFNSRLFQQLKDVRNELEQVKKERDILKREVLDCFRII